MAAMPPSPETLIAHGGFLTGLARNLLGDEHLAEDVVQQTYLRALSRPPPQGLRPWLATVARHLSLNDRRTRKRRAEREEASARPAAVPSTAEIVQREALRQQVVSAVLRLTEPYRSVVVLRYFEDLSPADIADRLGLPGSTVRSRLQRAHEMLRDSLDQAHGGDRARWATLLSPLARTLPTAGGTSLSPLSFLLMKKTLLGVVAAASLAAVAWFAFEGLSSPPGPQPVGDAAPLPPLDVAAEPTRSRTERQALEASRNTGPAEQPDPRAHPTYTAALVGFRGRVVNGDGAPVPHTGVEMYRLSLDALLEGGPQGGIAPHLRAGAAETGDDGVFTFRGIRPDGLFLLKAGLGTDSPTARIVQHAPAPGQIVDLGNVRLETMGSITGTAVDEGGNPVPDADVLAIDLPPFLGATLASALVPGTRILPRQGQVPISVVELPSWVRGVMDSLPIPRTRTDAGGRFVLPGVPRGTTNLAVIAAGLQPLMQNPVQVAEGEATDVGTLRLEHGAELRGRVVDALGEPVAGAQVLAAGNDPLGPFDIAGEPLSTDAEGRFTVTGFPATRVRLASRRSPEHRWVVTEPLQADDELELRLPSLHTLTLRLTSNAGLPVRSPKCTVFAGHGAALPELAAFGLALPIEVEDRIERDGDRLEIPGLEPGWYTVRVSDPTHALATLEVEVDADTDRDLSLDARVPLEVRLVDATASPVVGASVLAIPEPMPQWPASMPIPCGISDGAGRIALDRIPGAAVDVIATHPALGTVRKRVPRNQSPYTLAFADVGTIDGVLHDNNRPVDPSRWSVLLKSREDAGPFSFPRVVRPDDQGRFRFPALQPGAHRVQAVDSLDMLITPSIVMELNSWMPTSRVAEVDVQGGRVSEVCLDVGAAVSEQPGARITGTMMIDGKPGVGIMMIAELPDSRDPVVVPVDAGGRFDLGHVDSGQRFVYAFDMDQRSFADNQPHILWSGYVDVAADVDEELTIDVQTGTLAGAVLDADGQPAAEVWVEARGALTIEGRSDTEPTQCRYVVRTDSAGLFEIQGVPPGQWRVQATGPDTGSGEVEAVVEPGQRRDDLQVRMGRQVFI